MVRNPLTGEIEFDTPQVEGASLNGAVAPDGSAGRVLGIDDETPITVTDYDANGEAVDVVVVSTTTPEPMPGFDAPELDLWGDYHGRRVSSMALSFSGTCDLDGLRADVREAAPGVDLGKRLALRISGTVTGVKHKSSEARGPVAGVVTLAVDDVMFDAADHEAEDLRERIQAALTAIGEVRDQFVIPEGHEESVSDEEFEARSEALNLVDELLGILNGEDAFDHALDSLVADGSVERNADGTVRLTREERQADEASAEHSAMMAGLGDGPDVADEADTESSASMLDEAIGIALAPEELPA